MFVKKTLRICSLRAVQNPFILSPKSNPNIMRISFSRKVLFSNVLYIPPLAASFRSSLQNTAVTKVSSKNSLLYIRHCYNNAIPNRSNPSRFQNSSLLRRLNLPGHRTFATFSAKIWTQHWIFSCTSLLLDGEVALLIEADYSTVYYATVQNE